MPVERREKHEPHLAKAQKSNELTEAIHKVSLRWKASSLEFLVGGPPTAETSLNEAESTSPGILQDDSLLQYKQVSHLFLLGDVSTALGLQTAVWSIVLAKGKPTITSIVMF